MSKRRATLKDIAQVTGFSANTVSLALRGSARLPEETRERILKEAEKLNYFPNHIARSLARSATRVIGLVLTDIMNPTLTLAARTIERELSAAGYVMMFAASDTNVDNEKRAIALFQSYQVDGILIYPANHGEFDHIRAAADAGTSVLLLADLPGSGLDTVAIDDRAGAFKAISHLCATGHRHMAMLDGGQALGNLDKFNGARRAISQAGLSEDALTVFDPGGHTAQYGYASMEKVMRLDPVPSAVFTSTDALAFGVVRWCREHAVSIPAELAVIGYDNTDIAEYSPSPLTTVNYAAAEISRIGVEQILRRIENRESVETPVKRMVEPLLVIRDTA